MLLIIEESSVEEVVVSVVSLGKSSQSIRYHCCTPQFQRGVVAVDSEPERVVPHLNGLEFRQVYS